MCGIHCGLSTKSPCELQSDDVQRLRCRGPDSLETRVRTVYINGITWYISFTSSVLSLRGDHIEPQPIYDESSDSILCWNGEAWKFDGRRITGNDTRIIATRLFSAIHAAEESEASILKVFDSIQGPYAFVFYDARHEKIYFGRDPLGRRSLLISADSDQHQDMTIASVSQAALLSVSNEVKTSHVFFLDLKQQHVVPVPLSLPRSMPNINRSQPDIDEIDQIPTQGSIDNLLEALRYAIKLRVEDIPTYTPQGIGTDPSKVAVLFSGGLDCTLLTRLTHEILPLDQPIDLLNVAFENPRVVNAREAERAKGKTAVTTTMDTYETCPDRITGRSSFDELARECSGRTWRFVAINIPFEEFQEHRHTIIQLMRPHNTEMDLSITAALYFAARGRGNLTTSLTGNCDPQSYTTTARVLLSGLGADELFGGYARHAAAFIRDGYPALNDELELDFQRIGQRNLGRDDRVIAHWGRETRYPFLDETFVEFALGLPVWEKCGFRTDKPIPKHFESLGTPVKIGDLHPEKMLLRCAMWNLGMKGAAAEKKRAIQFGARTAKMHAGRTKGTDPIIINVD